MLKKIYHSVFTALLLTIFWPGVWGFANSSFNFTFLFAFLPLLLVEYQIRSDLKKKKFLRTFLFSWLSLGLFNAGTTFWVWNAHWSGVLATVLINGGLMGLIISIYGWVSRVHSQRIGYWTLVSGWLAFEVFHESWAFSFPWLDLGHAFASSPLIIQWYEFTGHRGGLFWILVSNLILFDTFLAFKRKRGDASLNIFNSLIEIFSSSRQSLKDNLKFFRPVLLIWFGPVALSLIIHLNFNSDILPERLGSIVQPNADPYEEKFQTSDQAQAKKWANSLILSFSNRLNKSNREEIRNAPDVVVFPETFFHEGIQESHANAFKPIHELDSILQLYPNTSLLVGASTYELYNEKQKTVTSRKIGKSGNKYYDVYNSAFVLSANKTLNFYHKSKLVVGVEYMPFGRLIQKLFGDLTIAMGGTSGTLATQENRDVFSLADTTIKIAPIICWEQDYGNYVRQYAKEGANVFAIMTNDGWWGNTLGHSTHMQYARIRAIENRRWILRSANTGISGFIDPKGCVSNAMTWAQKGIKTDFFQINNSKTFYTISGDLIGRAGTMLFPLILISVFVRKHVQS